MTCYLIKNNNNIIGIYNDLELSLDYIYGLLNANLIQKSSNIVIYEYKINSCIILQEYNIDLNYEILDKSIINYHKTLSKPIFIKQDDIKYENDSSNISSISINNSSEEERRKKEEKDFINKQTILGQDKINVVHNINLLKEELKKKEEKLTQYNYDLELYNKFKDLKNKNSLFVIPFMFEQKYNIFYVLDNNNKLSYDNFMEKYKPNKINTQYDELFEENESNNTVNSTISEIFSNASDTELYMVTNQIMKNNKDID